MQFFFSLLTFHFLTQSEMLQGIESSGGRSPLNIYTDARSSWDLMQNKSPWMDGRIKSSTQFFLFLQYEWNWALEIMYRITGENTLLTERSWYFHVKFKHNTKNALFTGSSWSWIGDFRRGLWGFSCLYFMISNTCSCYNNWIGPLANTPRQHTVNHQKQHNCCRVAVRVP